MRIRIIIADDHQIVRQGLKTFLEKEPDMEVVADAGDGEETVTLVRELVPDVVVMDAKCRSWMAPRPPGRSFPSCGHQSHWSLNVL